MGAARVATVNVPVDVGLVLARRAAFEPLPLAGEAATLSVGKFERDCGASAVRTCIIACIGWRARGQEERESKGTHRF